MPSVAWLPLASLCLALATGCAPRYQNLVERPLPLPDNLACPGYLVRNRAPVRDVFLVVNGSGIGSSAFVHPSFKALITTGPVPTRPSTSRGSGRRSTIRRRCGETMQPSRATRIHRLRMTTSTAFHAANHQRCVLWP